MSSILTQVRDLTVRPREKRVNGSHLIIDTKTGEGARPPLNGFFRATSQLQPGSKDPGLFV